MWRISFRKFMIFADILQLRNTVCKYSYAPREVTRNTHGLNLIARSADKVQKNCRTDDTVLQFLLLLFFFLDPTQTIDIELYDRINQKERLV